MTSVTFPDLPVTIYGKLPLIHSWYKTCSHPSEKMEIMETSRYLSKLAAHLARLRRRAYNISKRGDIYGHMPWLQFRIGHLDAHLKKVNRIIEFQVARARRRRHPLAKREKRLDKINCLTALPLSQRTDTNTSTASKRQSTSSKNNWYISNVPTINPQTLFVLRFTTQFCKSTYPNPENKGSKKSLKEFNESNWVRPNY
ncbi:hypothetical protein ACFE04_012675 [Oxalis oulophora]